MMLRVKQEDTLREATPEEHAANRARISRVLAEAKRKQPIHSEPSEHLGPLSAVLPTGAWSGQRCFIIGGGPSLRGFDFSLLRGELVIGINRAYEFFDSAILFSMDGSFLHKATHGKEYGAEALRKYNSILGTKVHCREGRSTCIPGVYHVDRTSPSWGASIESGICCGDNSGFGALVFAIALGAIEIYLLGFDMGGIAGKQAWFHSGHKNNQGDGVYKAMLSWFTRYKARIDDAARVINCNPDSNLRCFEFGHVPEPREDKPVVVGYYSRGTGYEAEAREMASSAHRMGYEVKLEGFDSLGGWTANTQRKADFLERMVREHIGRTIIYTDADSRFERYPAFFDSIDSQFAAHRRRNGELLSGTIYIRCNESTLSLMRTWKRECEKDTSAWDQVALDRALAVWDGERSELPESHCCIFDSKSRPKNAAVVHYQASRRLKKEVGA